MRFFYSGGAVLKVKLALYLHSLQTADSFLIFSHLGMSAIMFCHEPLRKVPLKDEIITILPLSANSSENSTISVKNCPSSIPMTSNGVQVEPCRPGSECTHRTTLSIVHHSSCVDRDVLGLNVPAGPHCRKSSVSDADIFEFACPKNSSRGMVLEVLY